MATSEPVMANAFRMSRQDGLPSELRETLTRRQHVLGAPYRLFYATPVHMVSAQGVWLEGKDGRRYLDAYNNVQCVGHSHPAVIAALTQQAARLTTHTRYLEDIILAYAERLLGSFPDALSKAMFTCTGSEANDLALRIAKAHTGGTGIVVTSHAYHGVTEAVAALSPSLGDGVPLGTHVRAIAPPTESDGGAAFAERTRAALADLLRHGIAPAALLVDTIFSSDGVLPEAALAGAVAAAREAGAIFIADEVQAGFGRTGEAMWGFARHGVVPDLVTLGKPMGNGYPMAAVIARPEILDVFAAKSRYFNTFGGTAVVGAVGSAVLDVIASEGLVENALETGRYLLAGLRELSARHPSLGAVRGTGLFIGADIVDPQSGRADPAAAETLVDDMRAEGVLASASGPAGNVLKIRPPLVFRREHADLLLAAVDTCLSARQARRPSHAAAKSPTTSEEP